MTDYNQMAREWLEDFVRLDPQVSEGCEGRLAANLARKFREISEAGVYKGKIQSGEIAEPMPPTHFQPGMRIGPEYSYGSILTLKKFIESRKENWFEVWECEDGQQYYFRPDDLDRVIGDKPDPALEAARHTFPHKAVVPAAKPQTEWNVGQMLIDELGFIYKLLRYDPMPVGVWSYEIWTNGKWKRPETPSWCNFGGAPAYVPYPRVGDWVKYKSPNHSDYDEVFKVARMLTAETGEDEEGIAFNVINLEPASPPVEEDCQHNYEGDRSANPRCCKCQQLRDNAEPPSHIQIDRPLEGEHWDGSRIGPRESASYKRDCDLRSEFRRLVEAMKDADDARE